tara:strand:- start:586 stop:891 length:306 start_codon:yes stop_codon:yes gene_type:complete
MKITKSQLEKIIKEELKEGIFGSSPSRDRKLGPRSLSDREHATGPLATKKHAELILALLENLNDDIMGFADVETRQRLLPGLFRTRTSLRDWIQELGKEQY